MLSDAKIAEFDSSEISVEQSGLTFNLNKALQSPPVIDLIPTEPPKPKPKPKKQLNIPSTNFNFTPVLEQLKNEKFPDENPELKHLEHGDKEFDYCIMVVGVTGCGKSSFCNYMFKKAVFDASAGAIAVTSTCNSNSLTINQKKILFIDTPGFSDEKVSNEQRVSDLGSVFLLAKNGLHAIVICFSGSSRFDTASGDTIRELNLLGDFWDHTFIVYTHADEIGRTEQEQTDCIYSWYHDQNCPDMFKNLHDKVEGRFMTIESKNRIGNTDYYNMKANQFLEWVQFIFHTRNRESVYTNDLFIWAKNEYDKAKQEKQKYEKALKEALDKIAEREAQIEKNTEELENCKSDLQKLTDICNKLKMEQDDQQKSDTEKDLLYAKIRDLSEQLLLKEADREYRERQLKEANKNLSEVKEQVDAMKAVVSKSPAKIAHEKVTKELPKKTFFQKAKGFIMFWRK